MARTLCTDCEKPLKACLCSFITAINNQINVVILQHPNEVNQSKGTVPLIANALTQCTVVVGDDFLHNDTVNQLISHYGKRCLLLYPSENAVTLHDYVTNIHDVKAVDYVENVDDLCLLVLDGTWKKTYRMYMQSSNLHSLTQLTLPDTIEGQYHIRKTKKAHALSTLEACYYCLTILEGNDENNEAKYLPLIENFKKFNDFQLSFRPPEHLER